MIQKLTLFVIFYCLSWQLVMAEDVYSKGGWPTLHGDAGNRRAVDTAVLPHKYNKTWHELKGITVLTAPTASPDGKKIYVTTGLPQGNSNLHAFTIEGQRLWQSEPWHTDVDGLDTCAFLSSPIIDEQGDIYINDCNQLFAYTANGVVKWVTKLPAIEPGDWAAAGEHPVNAFTTAAFTREGHILGVTNFGDVVIVDRASGDILNRPYRLPGLIPPKSTNGEMPASMFANGRMDPNFRAWTWEVMFAGTLRSANTPAISKHDRIFVVASSANEGAGALYGLDVVKSQQSLEYGIEIKEAFATDIGLGSGSSPALSNTEDQVYVCDDDGWFYAIDASNGAIRWKIKTRAAPGAAGVGKQGTVYAFQSGARIPPIIAISNSGQILWESDFSTQAMRLPKSFFFGHPVAVANGNPTITGDAVIIPIFYGYEIPFIGAVAPVQSTIAAVDTQTGEVLRDVVELPDESDGISVVLANGTIVNSLGSASTSAISPLKTIINWLLPGDLKILEAVSGVHVALPDVK